MDNSYYYDSDEGDEGDVDFSGIEIETLYYGSDYDDYSNDEASDLSLEYERVDGRAPNLRLDLGADSDASSLSDTEGDGSFAGADIWDDISPIYERRAGVDNNQLTMTMKRMRKMFTREHANAPWVKGPEQGAAASFWRKEHGWPQQLLYSNSSATHFQCANALDVSSSDYGLSDEVFTVYKSNILQCRKSFSDKWAPSFRGCSNDFVIPPQKDGQRLVEDGLTEPSNTTASGGLSTRPYTKYFRTSLYPDIPAVPRFLNLNYEPLCFAHKYGFLGVGGDRGRFSIYCTMGSTGKPVQIPVSNIRMTHDQAPSMFNSIQIYRWRIVGTDCDEGEMMEDDPTDRGHSHKFNYKAIIATNGCGVIVCSLKTHDCCCKNEINSAKSRSFTARLTTASPVNQASMEMVNGFQSVLVNDAKVSPNGRWMVCVGDAPCIFFSEVIESGRTFCPAVRHNLPRREMMSDGSLYTSQYLSWNSTSTLVANSSDSCRFVLVWSMPQVECIYSIPAGGYSYAIAFHPLWNSVLSFTNRFGYLHTVDLEQGVDISLNTPTETTRPLVNLMEWTAIDERGDADLAGGRRVLDSRATILRQYERNLKISARHEITMVSFHSRRDKHLRVLAKLNGLGWSRDGTKLYVATQKRVLSYEFLRSSRRVKSLVEICGYIVRSAFERHDQVRAGKRSQEGSTSLEGEAFSTKSKAWEVWGDDWAYVPDAIKQRVLGDSVGLASHW